MRWSQQIGKEEEEEEDFFRDGTRMRFRRLGGFFAAGGGECLNVSFELSLHVWFSIFSRSGCPRKKAPNLDVF